MRPAPILAASLVLSACATAEPPPARPWFDTPEMARVLEADAPCDGAYAAALRFDADSYVGPVIPIAICDGGPCETARTCGSFSGSP